MLLVVVKVLNVCMELMSKEDGLGGITRINLGNRVLGNVSRLTDDEGWGSSDVHGIIRRYRSSHIVQVVSSR